MSEPTARLLRLLSLLQAGREWTGAELAEQISCSPRTLRRDIDRLREQGYPIHASRGTAGYRLEAGTDLPPLLLDDDEAVAVVVGLRTAKARHVTGIEEMAERALAKLERLLPSRLRHRVGALDAVTIPTAPPGPTVDADVLTLVAGACRDRQRLRLDYTDHDGAATVRRVEPHRLVHTGRRWYLVAYDLDRDGWRSFRMDRLRPRSPSLGGFTPREIPGGDAAAFVTRSVTGRLWRYHVRVRLRVPAAAVAEHLPASTGSLTVVDERSCLLDIGGDSPARLAGDLCALDVDFEVEDAPVEVTNRLQVMADRLARVV